MPPPTFCENLAAKSSSVIKYLTNSSPTPPIAADDQGGSMPVENEENEDEEASEDELSSAPGDDDSDDDDDDDEEYVEDDEEDDEEEDSGDEQKESSNEGEVEEEEKDPYAYREGDTLVIRAVVEQQQRRGDAEFLVRRFEGTGHTPLHHAIYQGASLPVIRYLVSERPKALTIKTCASAEALLPLHLAIVAGSPDDVVQFLVDRGPNAARARTKERHLALHLAVDDRGRVPLRVDTLRRLIRAHLGALRVYGRDGLPLHMLLDGGVVPDVTVEMVAAFVEPHPDLLKVQDGYGLLPLYAAAKNNKLPMGVLRYLVDACPESAHMWARQMCPYGGNSVRDGKLPIHLALEARSSLRRIKFFLTRYPESIREEDADGDLPVHTAAKSGVPLDAFRFVVRQWPGSVR
jgi:ankyrin repeat protein